MILSAYLLEQATHWLLITILIGQAHLDYLLHLHQYLQSSLNKIIDATVFYHFDILQFRLLISLVYLLVSRIHDFDDFLTIFFLRGARLFIIQEG